MKKYLVAILFLVLGMTQTTAQQRRAEVCTEEEIPAENRKMYIKSVTSFIEEYYQNILFTVEDVIIHHGFIERFMINGQQGYCPEYGFSTGNNNLYLLPEQYLQEMGKTFKDVETERMTLEVSNIRVLPDFYRKGLTGCYLAAEYDLALMLDTEIIYKRQCKAYCLFPQAINYMNVKLMQVEPGMDIIAFQRTKLHRDSQIVIEETPFAYDYMFPISEDIYPVYKNGKHGFTNASGELVIPLIYDDAFEFSEGLAAVEKKNKWGFIDKTGRVVIPFEFNYGGVFQEGLCNVEKGNKDIFIDRYGKKAIPKNFYHTTAFKDGVARVGKKRGEMYIIDRQGNEKNSIPYDKILEFNEGLAVARRVYDKSGKDWIYSYGFIDKEGNEVVPLIYQSARSFSEGLAAVRKGDKWGYIDRYGNVVVPFKYDDAFKFSEGLAEVRLNGEGMGYINKMGTEVIPIQYDCYEYQEHKFSEGLARVIVNNKIGYIDQTGKMMIEPVYNQGGHFKEGLAFVVKDDRAFIIGKDEKVLIELSSVPEFSHGIDVKDLVKQGTCMYTGKNKQKYLLKVRIE